MITVLFFIIAICGILLCGNAVGTQFTQSLADINGTWFSTFGQVVLASVLKSIVDCYFFSAKECALAAYDEYSNQSMSKKLDAKIAKRISE